MSNASISTHVLDISIGRPAAGVPIVLSIRGDDGAFRELGRGRTDADGRLRGLLPEAQPLAAGTYRIVFDTAAYFAARGVTGFYPEVSVLFTITAPTQHHHVPLLLSPFGYSTYRGS